MYMYHHGLNQFLQDETEQFGAEELRRLKQIRVSENVH